MKRAAILLLLLLAFGGCFLDAPEDKYRVEAVAAEQRARKARAEASEERSLAARDSLRAARIDRLRAASRRSAAYADSVVHGIGKCSEFPNSSPTERNEP